jgi:hypothetical protein
VFTIYLFVVFDPSPFPAPVPAIEEEQAQQHEGEGVDCVALCGTVVLSRSSSECQNQQTSCFEKR